MPITQIDQLGPEIRKTRKALGLSQTDLALATGLSIKFLSQLETGKADNPSFANILDIIRALGGQVTLDWTELASSNNPAQTDGDGHA